MKLTLQMETAASNPKGNHDIDGDAIDFMRQVRAIKTSWGYE